MSFELAQKVADAVLWEGYVLYPYRASAGKNRVRFQWGVLAPRAYTEIDPSETWLAQTEGLLEAEDDANLEIAVRFLQAQAKMIEEADDQAGSSFHPVGLLELDDAILSSWDEAIEHTVTSQVSVSELVAGEREVPFVISGGSESELVHRASGELAGRITRQRWPVSGVIRCSAQRLEGPYDVLKVRVRVENLTEWQASGIREEALRRSLLGTHTMLKLTAGSFISLLEPPEWAQPAVKACDNLKTWPVLIGQGRRDTMLSSPIILYDYPEVAKESPSDLFDATEIDEILTLRTMALTEEEKREARGTDARAAALINRVDSMPPEMLERLHGTVRYMRELDQPSAQASSGGVPYWGPELDTSVSPETDIVLIGGVAVRKGSRISLRPGLRRADAQDMFLRDRIARVEAVFLDVDGKHHLAVTLEEDPAADLHEWYGRFLYFAPDEVEPLEASH